MADSVTSPLPASAPAASGPSGARPFRVVSDFAPAGDQPAAIAALADGVERGDRFQTLLGITGSGKSATIAWTIEQVQRPTLVIAPNKSLAAQLANEMREFFPDNRVEYFVSLLRLLPARGLHPLAATPTSRRTARSTTRSTGCATRPPRPCSPGATSSSWPRCRASTAWARPRSTRKQILHAAAWARTTTSAPSCAGWSTCSTSATTPTWSGASSGCGATPSRCTRPTRSTRCASSCSATRSSASPRSTR